ncbi:MAG: hypothetical protein ILP02_01680 [Clostridia bacterium]|nr:hypothetical protein [Clostridia bacterium]
MAKKPTETTGASNGYLKRMTAWKESSVPAYNLKTGHLLFLPWLYALIDFLILFTAVGHTLFLLTDLVENYLIKLPDLFKTITFALICLIITAAFSRRSAKKRIKQLVEDNRGEVGRKGQPLIRRTALALLLGVAALAGSLAACWFLIVGSFENLNFASVKLAAPIVFSAGFPFMYYVTVVSTIFSLRKKACPECGRLNALTVFNLTYPERGDGVYTYDAYDGIVDNNEDENGDVTFKKRGHPFYGEVAADTHMLEYGDKKSDTFICCRYCSFSVRNENTKAHKKLLRRAGDEGN